jgi:hypothetical protein
MMGFEKSGHHLVADLNSLTALLRSAVIDEVGDLPAHQFIFILLADLPDRIRLRKAGHPGPVPVGLLQPEAGPGPAGRGTRRMHLSPSPPGGWRGLPCLVK